MNFNTPSRQIIVVPILTLPGRYHTISALHNVDDVLMMLIDAIGDTHDYDGFYEYIVDALVTAEWEAAPNTDDVNFMQQWSSSSDAIHELAADLWNNIVLNPVINSNNPLAYLGTTNNMSAIMIGVS